MSSEKNQLSVLLIEDSEEDFLIFSAMLQNLSEPEFQVSWAQDYSTARDYLLRQKWDAVLIDYFLGGFHDGIELVRELREQDVDTPLVLLTGKEEREIDLQAMQAGVDGFLPKLKVTAAQLERTLRYAMEYRHQQVRIRQLNEELEARIAQRTRELLSSNYALQESEQRARLIKEVASIANAAPTIEAVLMKALEQVSSYTGWPVGHVYFHQRLSDRHLPRLISSELWYCSHSAYFESFSQASPQDDMLPWEGLPGQVYCFRKPYWYNFTQRFLATEICVRSEIAVKYGLMSHLGFPVMVEDQVLAVLEFFSLTEDRPEPVLLELMAQIGHELGYAIERKRVEGELRLSQERQSLAQQIAGVGFWEWDFRNHRALFSDEACQLMGLAEGLDSIQAAFEQCSHPEDRKEVLRTLDLALQQEPQAESDFSLEHRFVHADETVVYVYSRGSLLVDHQGEPLRYLGVMQDITRHKESERIQQDLRQAAEAANLSKSVFLANMSHEIRTPMNAILGTAQLMQRHSGRDEQQDRYLNTILRAGEHLLSLINEILEMSKIEAGQMVLNYSDFDLRYFLQDLQLLFEDKLCSLPDVKLEVQIAAEVPDMVHTDAGKLRQVLINLLGNAVKFTTYGKISLNVALRLDAESEQTFLDVAVSDTGMGIAAHEMDKLFKSFEQTASGRFRQGGTGLGLALCDKYMHLLGGSIHAESVEDQGSTFSFSLPVVIPEVQILESTTKRYERVSALAPDEPEWRILVTDDEGVNRQIVLDFLRPLGFALQEAVSGEQALQQVAEWHPHLVLMDLSMPGMNGLDAIRRLRAEPEYPDLKMIALTANAFEDDRHRALDAGADDFLAKPFRACQLFEKLAENLDLHYLFYDEEQQQSNAQEKMALDLPPLAELPAALLSELREAAQAADLDRLLELNESLKAQDPGRSQQIQAFAAAFDYAKIMEILEVSLI